MMMFIFFLKVEVISKEDKLITGPGFSPGIRGTSFLLPVKTANSLKCHISPFKPGRTMENTYWGLEKPPCFHAFSPEDRPGRKKKQNKKIK